MKLSYFKELISHSNKDVSNALLIKKSFTIWIAFLMCFTFFSINTLSDDIQQFDLQPGGYYLNLLNVTLMNETIQTMVLDEGNNTLCVGTQQGMSIVDVKNETSTNLSWEDGLVGNNTMEIEIDYGRSQLYVGFYSGKGVNVYNWLNGAIGTLPLTSVPEYLFIRGMIYNPRSDQLYVGTDGDGLFIYNFTDGSTTCRNYTHGLPSDQIFSLELDTENDILYIGTIAGLAIYNLKNDSFSVRGTIDGLASNYVSRITLDEIYQRLYITTGDTELSVYDIVIDSFSKYEFGDRWPGPMAIDYTNNHLYIVGGNAIANNSTRRICTYSTTNMSLISVLDISAEFDWPISELIWDADDNWLYIGGNKIGIYDPYFIDESLISISEELDVDGNHTISWVNVDNAKWYTLERASTVNFTSPETIYYGINTEYAVQDTPEGTYWYRVRGNNSVRIGNWSESISITVLYVPNAPTLDYWTSPDNDGSYTVSWNEVYNAESYLLEEADNGNFTSSIVVYNGNNSFFNISNKPNGTHFYRVRAINQAGESDWSNILLVTISPDHDNDYFISSIVLIILLSSSIILIFGLILKRRKVKIKENKNRVEEK